MLEKFLFPPAAQYAVIANLSGGERRRLYLLKILMDSPNVLLLDEPTNDLDIPTLIALEEYLDDFAGALIVVSHDRYFLDRTIDNVFKFEGGGKIREYAGDYSAYLEYKAREEAVKTEENKILNKAAEAKTNQKSSNESRKLTFKEKRELETLEANIAADERRQAEIEEELNLFATDSYKVNQLYTEQQQTAEKLEKNLERWAELADREA
jgi:ATP-binding cassette subfamily F protein uup